MEHEPLQVRGSSPPADPLPQSVIRPSVRFTFALCAIVAALALAFAAAGAAACSNPVLAPEAEACIVSARGVKTGTESGLALSVRVSVKGSLSLERLGITVRAESDRRSYWHTDIVAEEVPAGGSLILETALAFDSGDEAYVEGSAVIESAWFE